MWLVEILKMIGLALFAILVMSVLGIIFMELVDLFARFILWLGPDPFFIWFW